MKNITADNEILLVLVITIFFILNGLLITLFFLSSSKRQLIMQYEGFVAPFFSLPAVLFSLIAALLASSIWENYSLASKAIKNESQGLIDIINLSEEIPQLKNSNLVNSTRTYAKSVVEEE